MAKITDFAQLSDYDVIVNCTGIKARILAQDEQVIAYRGQIARAKAPWHFQTFIEEDKGTCAIVNYDTVVLGGTCQEGDYNRNPVDFDTKMILKGCYEMIPALKNAPIVKHMVGIRPGRTKVRLEVDYRKIDNKNLGIVHNYGHGGAGVTLSYGCALEAAKLVKQALNASYRSKL